MKNDERRQNYLTRGGYASKRKLNLITFAELLFLVGIFVLIQHF